MKRTAIFLMILSFFTFASCRFMGGKRVEGNGQRVTDTRSLGNFSGVDVRGAIDVFVTNGADYSIRIEADQNLMEYIEVENDGGIVEVSSRDGYNLHSPQGIKVYATAPQFSRIGVSGSGDIRSEGQVKGDSRLSLDIRGSGDIQLAVDAPEIETSISGSGSARLRGNTRSFNADIRGSGDIRAFELLSENASVDIAGSGNAEVFASKQLSVDIKGAGDVAYKGGGNVNQSIKGSGSVRQVQ